MCKIYYSASNNLHFIMLPKYDVFTANVRNIAVLAFL